MHMERPNRSRALRHGNNNMETLADPATKSALTAPASASDSEQVGSGGDAVDMPWDLISRFGGRLGIYAKIDVPRKKVVECHSTSSIFRGYSGYMKNKDPRDSHLKPSGVGGPPGDFHARSSIQAQNMAYAIKPPPLSEWTANLCEAAEYMFDHNVFQHNFTGADFCENTIRETNPGVWEKAMRTSAPHADDHGHRTIAEILRSLNPPDGAYHREALQMSQIAREMIAMMSPGPTPNPIPTPGRAPTLPSAGAFADYLAHLGRYAEFMKKAVPFHDDLFNFFYEALPGYEMVGRRRVLLGCWGSFQDPNHCDYTYRNMGDWGNRKFVTPGVVVDGELVTTDLVKINVGLRILLGSSFYENWDRSEMFVTKDPLGNPIDRRHPWNQDTIPKPQKQGLGSNFSWVMSPRWLHPDTGEHLALDTGGGPIARLWATALAGKVDIGYVKATGGSVRIRLPRTSLKPEAEFEWKIPLWSNAIERDRARTYFQAYAAGVAYHCAEQAMKELNSGTTKSFESFSVPEEAIGCCLNEAVRGVHSHHIAIRNGKIANYYPCAPTPWNASPRDVFGTPGPYEDAVQNTPLFEENAPDGFRGIDVMRAVRSFDPCQPCRIHMHLGPGIDLQQLHSPDADAVC
jgi:hydrogenase large subunit